MTKNRPTILTARPSAKSKFGKKSIFPFGCLPNDDLPGAFSAPLSLNVLALNWLPLTDIFYPK